MLISIDIFAFFLVILRVLNSVHGKPTSNKIAGGDIIRIETAPYHVLIEWESIIPIPTCSGAIIDEYHVLTAAECVAGGEPEWYFVRTGTGRLTSGGELYHVVNMWYPDEFFFIDYNIAVLEVQEPIKFNNATQPIPRAEKETPVGAAAYVTGWGQSNENQTEFIWSSFLEGVYVSVTDWQVCHDSYIGGVTERMVCAADPAGGKGACTNDMGSPLVFNNTLIGISCFQSCGRVGKPDMYSDVFIYKDWIDGVLKNATLGRCS